MAESINDFLVQIDQIIFWLKILIYLILSVIGISLISVIRRSLGIDSNSIELRRIRRLLEERKKEKPPEEKSGKN